MEGSSNRMLNEELKELEINQLIRRTVLDTQPIISNLTDWGIVHRKAIAGK